MFIKDNEKVVVRCDICHAECGLSHEPSNFRVMVANILAAEICGACINKTVLQVQKLLSKEAVEFYRSVYGLSIDH